MIRRRVWEGWRADFGRAEGGGWRANFWEVGSRRLEVEFLEVGSQRSEVGFGEVGGLIWGGRRLERSGGGCGGNEGKGRWVGVKKRLVLLLARMVCVFAGG